MYKNGMDKEYGTTFRGEVDFLRSKGINYTFVKNIEDASLYKYVKTGELFIALSEYYKINK